MAGIGKHNNFRDSEMWELKREAVINKIKELILLSGHSSSEVAVLAGLSAGTMTNMYRQGKLSSKMANKISQFLGFDNFSKLLDEDKSKRDDSGESKAIEGNSLDDENRNKMAAILIADLRNKLDQLEDLISSS